MHAFGDQSGYPEHRVERRLPGGVQGRDNYRELGVTTKRDRDPLDELLARR